MTTSTHGLIEGYHAKAGPRAHSNGPAFLTARDVADMTGLHVAVIRRAIERGELRAHKLCSRIRVQPEDFAAWLDANLVEPGVD